MDLVGERSEEEIREMKVGKSEDSCIRWYAPVIYLPLF